LLAKVLQQYLPNRMRCIPSSCALFKTLPNNGIARSELFHHLELLANIFAAVIFGLNDGAALLNVIMSCDYSRHNSINVLLT